MAYLVSSLYVAFGRRLNVHLSSLKNVLSNYERRHAMNINTTHSLRPILLSALQSGPISYLYPGFRLLIRSLVVSVSVI